MLTLTHADYSRGRLLRLLDTLDAAPPGRIVQTLALLAGGAFPALPVADAHAAPLAEHASRSETGAVVFVGAPTSWLVAPPYPLSEPFSAPGVETAPLRRLLAAERRLAVVLLRLGGYAIGVYEGDRLIEARNDARFVKNRHRKGGQSQRRFDRIREKQVHGLFDHLCGDAAERLTPWQDRLDFLVYGGDRHAVLACLKECRFLREFPAAVLPRFLTVPEPRHETLVTLPVLLNSSRVTVVSDGPAP